MSVPLTPRCVKVDNWGIFFLNRLEQSFERGDFCDLTLRFSSQAELKVHSLVLNACTEYFLALEKQGLLKNGYLELPSDLMPEVVIPIIRFMYTGKLELVEGMQHELYVAAQQLHMSVLTKLLDAQREPMKPLGMQRAGGIAGGGGLHHQQMKKHPPVTYSLQGKKITPKSPLPPMKREKEDWPDPLPGRKLPIWKRRPPKSPQSTSILGQPTQSEAAWAEGRKESFLRPPPEPPRPTRFEWPENDPDMDNEAPFATITYESQLLSRPKSPTNVGGPAQPHNATAVKAEVFEELRKTMTVKRGAGDHQAIASAMAAEQMSHLDAKKPKLDIAEVREYVEEQRARRELMIGRVRSREELGDGEEGLADAEMEEDGVDDYDEDNVIGDDDDDDEMVEGEEGVMGGEEVASGEEVATAEEVVASGSAVLTPLLAPPVLPTPQKSILRTQKAGPKGKEVENGGESNGAQPKKVRFLLKPDELEGADQGGSQESVPATPPPTRKEASLPKLPTAASSANQQNNLTNHARIISEVLRKYPQLVRDNKNIKLKIMQRGQFGGLAPDGGGGGAEEVSEDGGGGGGGGTPKVVKSRVSYVVLKSGDKLPGGKQSVVLRTGNQTLSEIVSTEPAPSIASGAENTTGPWLCYTCGSGADDPQNFETYYLYRKHLQEVHREKIDSRICEHCGHRASKRNLLLYHLYTKHNVQPPRNCQFPKCDQCGYIALSESLLIKHRNSHSHARDFVCKECDASFKSNGALQGHIQANLHGNHTSRKTYECNLCDSTFARNINLKAHLRSVHKRAKGVEEAGGVVAPTPLGAGRGTPRRRGGGRGARSTPIHRRGKMKAELVEEESEEDEDDEDPLVDPPHLDQVSQAADHSQVVAQHHAQHAHPPPHLDPSSEAEALSNVASGIAASLGLVEEHLVATTAVSGGVGQEVIVSYHPATLVTDGNQQYIIPEVDAPDEQVTVTYAGPLSDLEHYAAAVATTSTSISVCDPDAIVSMSGHHHMSLGSSTVQVHEMPLPTSHHQEVHHEEIHHHQDRVSVDQQSGPKVVVEECPVLPDEGMTVEGKHQVVVVRHGEDLMRLQGVKIVVQEVPQEVVQRQVEQEAMYEGQRAALLHGHVPQEMAEHSTGDIMLDQPGDAVLQEHPDDAMLQEQQPRKVEITIIEHPSEGIAEEVYGHASIEEHSQDEKPGDVSLSEEQPTEHVLEEEPDEMATMEQPDRLEESAETLLAEQVEDSELAEQVEDSELAEPADVELAEPADVELAEPAERTIMEEQDEANIYKAEEEAAILQEQPEEPPELEEASLSEEPPPAVGLPEEPEDSASLPTLEEEPGDSSAALPPLEEEPEDSSAALPPLEEEPDDSSAALPPLEEEPDDSSAALPSLEEEPDDSSAALPPLEEEPDDSSAALPSLEEEPEDAASPEQPEPASEDQPALEERLLDEMPVLEEESPPKEDQPVEEAPFLEEAEEEEATYAKEPAIAEPTDSAEEAPEKPAAGHLSVTPDESARESPAEMDVAVAQDEPTPPQLATAILEVSEQAPSMPVLERMEEEIGAEGQRSEEAMEVADNSNSAMDEGTEDVAAEAMEMGEAPDVYMDDAVMGPDKP